MHLKNPVSSFAALFGFISMVNGFSLDDVGVVVTDPIEDQYAVASYRTNGAVIDFALQGPLLLATWNAKRGLTKLVSLPTNSGLSVKTESDINLICAKLVVSTRGPLCASGNSIYNVKSGEKPTKFKDFKGQVLAMYSSDNDLYVGIEGGRLSKVSNSGKTIWDIQCRPFYPEADYAQAAITNIVLVKGTVYVGDKRGFVQGYLAENGSRNGKALFSPPAIQALAANQESGQLFVATQDTLRYTASNRIRLHADPKFPSGGVASMIFKDGSLFVGTRTGRVEQWVPNWDNTTVFPLTQYIGHDAKSPVVALAVNGGSLYSGSTDKTIKKWNVFDKKFLDPSEPFSRA